MFVAAEARIDIGTVERRSRREAVDAAAAHEEDEIDEDVALGANLAFIARFAQGARGGAAAAVAKQRHAHPDQLDAAECGDQPARVVPRLAPHPAGPFLIPQGFNAARRLLPRVLISITRTRRRATRTTNE